MDALSVYAGVKDPPSPKRPCAPRLLFYEFRVTPNCFWAGFLSKSVSSGAILSKIVHKHAGIYSSIIRLLFSGIILWLRWPNVFFFALTLSNMFPAKWYLAVEDTSRLCRRKILSVFVSEELVLRRTETDILLISCSDVVWIPDCIGCETLASKFNSFDLILCARCKQSGSRVCNKWMVLQDCFLFFLCIYRRTIELK